MRMWPALDVGPEPDPPDLFQAALVDYSVAAVDDNTPGRWRLFFHDSDERDRAKQGLAPDFPQLTFSAVDVPDEDWAARSQASLRAVRIGAIVVAPPWDVPAPDPSMTLVTILPSMGFGTGHHATTRLCLSALQRLDLRGRSALDVGTGSGVLAIAASLLGAAPVVAIDDDPDAVQSAQENFAANSGVSVDARVVDLRHASLPTFDLVMANLTGGLLIQTASRLYDLTAAGGHLILSGFMTHEQEEVLASFNRGRESFVEDTHAGFSGVSSTNDSRPLFLEEDEWVCATLRK